MLYVNSSIPAVETLRAEGLDVVVGQPAGVPRIGLLNLMPEKVATEHDYCRMLAQSGLMLSVVLLRLPGETYKTTPQSYVEAHYEVFDPDKAPPALDGLIVTGAPLEQMPFEAVRYWERLCRIFDWSAQHVRSTLCICWAAQAAFYHSYGLPKYALVEKCFGIFRQEVLLPGHPLLNALPSVFPMPHSRHTAVDFEGLPDRCLVLSAGLDTGVSLVVDETLRRVMVIGHLEYAADTLDREYRRDLSRNLPIQLPEHYYHKDDPAQGVDFSWAAAAQTFYRNWAAGLMSDD